MSHSTGWNLRDGNCVCGKEFNFEPKFNGLKQLGRSTVLFGGRISMLKVHHVKHNPKRFSQI